MINAIMNDLDTTLTALADPTRRHVVELLRDGPLRASELAEGSGMSRPAMSRHLRVLRASGLVEVTMLEDDARGRVYSCGPNGSSPSRRGSTRCTRSGRSSSARSRSTPSAPGKRRDASRRRLCACRSRSALDPDTAFEVFTEEIDAWYRRGPHNFADPARAVGIRFEPGRGRTPDRGLRRAHGRRSHGGEIVVWEPGHRLVFVDNRKTEVDVVFEPDGDGGHARDARTSRARTPPPRRSGAARQVRRTVALEVVRRVCP